MKKSILLIILIATASFVKSQDTIMAKTKSLPLPVLTAGDELIKSADHFYLGVEFMAAGAVIALIPTSSNMNQKPFNLIGGTLGFIGFAILCESHIHIRQAGILMNIKPKPEIILDKDGIGIVFAIK